MEGDYPALIADSVPLISIHSLRMEGDISLYMEVINLIISIHSLRMEGDNNTHIIVHLRHGFQSTPSVWRETRGWDCGNL